MTASTPQASVSDATVVPRVGVAVFIVDKRGYVLLGKRFGSHGSGTLVCPLALRSPGGVTDVHLF